MREWLTFIAESVIVTINAAALVIIVIGTVDATLRSTRTIFTRSSMGHQLRDAYLQYARWLVAGLTFQIAADIIETSIAPTWDDIGRLGAIAVIRTFLNFFLERDLAEVEQREAKSQGTLAASP
jgi:uncharacterized membrane protein